ncbi:MAG: FFLEELY motif protein [Candidatus Competibacteraceae bacterium]
MPGAFCGAACNEQRRHSIDLVERLGRDLQRIVQKRFIHTALKLAKGPARLTGVGELHRFLDTGFRAFQHLDTEAGTFVTTITERERALLEQMQSGHPHPLQPKDPAGVTPSQPPVETDHPVVDEFPVPSAVSAAPAEIPAGR